MKRAVASHAIPTAGACKKGAKRLHLVGQEHAENVTVAACGNALGQLIPSMILFKGKRQKPEWIDSMPPGTSLHFYQMVISFFSNYKLPGRFLLSFDGAASHLDASIADSAKSHDITLLCLPSNTTHELQPEHFWDREDIEYMNQNAIL